MLLCKVVSRRALVCAMALELSNQVALAASTGYGE